MSSISNDMRKTKGFSLIELLIVVAIILVIAAIAIPNLMRARISSNDAAAASTIRSINTAEMTYSTQYIGNAFAPTLAILGPGATDCSAADATFACLVDNVVGCATAPCTKGGYNYWVTASAATLPVPDYTASASPLMVGVTGSRNYCSNADAVIRMNTGAAAKLTTAVALAGCADISKYVALQ